jgi:hypothetical protein
MRAILRVLRLGFGRWGSARERGRRLLLANLTPVQRKQYSLFGHFDVLGGETGHRYRICQGDALNIDEYDRNGTYISRWCFAPVGKLVLGDVLLSQKLALELFESVARAVANRYPIDYPRSIFGVSIVR